MHKALSGALTASALMVTPLPGSAESEPAKQLKLEEVIVTAQKRGVFVGCAGFSNRTGR